MSNEDEIVYSCKDIFDNLFKWEDGKSVCKLCEKALKMNKSKGNAKSHMKNQHADEWMAAMASSGVNAGRQQMTITSNKSSIYYNCIMMILKTNISFNAYDSEYMQEILKRGSPCSKTLKQFICQLAAKIKQDIAAKLKKPIGIMMDGWTQHGTHYCGVYALVPNCDPILIAFSPFEDESSFDADSHVSFLKDTMEQYNKTANDIDFLVCDSASVNISVSKKLKVPMVGCFAHRLNLAFKKHLNDNEEQSEVIKKVAGLMVQLRQLKDRGQVKKLTSLKPLIDCPTRWSSTVKMLKRYVELKNVFCESLTSELSNDEDSQNVSDDICVLSNNAELQLKSIKNHVVDKILLDSYQFDMAVLRMQGNDVTISDALAFNEVLIEYYDGIESYLGTKHKYGESDFINAVGKIQRGQEDALNVREKQMVKPLLTGHISEETDTSEDVFERKLKRYKVSESNSRYVDTKFVKPTTCTVERLFSKAKNVMTDSRSQLSKELVSSMFILRENQYMWNETTVERVLSYK